MKNKVYDIPMEFIENSIEIGIKFSEAISRGEKKYVEDFRRYDNDLTNIYFIGRSLCLDVKNPIGDIDTIKLNWDSECFGYINGGPRRLLSIKSLKSFQKLMDICEINYQPKEILL